MLEYASQICVRNKCNQCPLEKVCKGQKELSREDTEKWIIDMEVKAKKILDLENRLSKLWR